jgi:glycerophosphoryl diester phosphodiesterase
MRPGRRARATTSAAASRSRADRAALAFAPLVIAHRGASAACPENTHAAFERALELGADGIELDLQLSRDGGVVVYHDRTLKKVGHGGRRIGQVDLAELRELDVGTWMHPRFRAERMPTLHEVLERYGARTRLLLELKLEAEDGPARRRRLLQATIEATRASGHETRVCLLSFDAAILRAAKRLAPELSTVLDVDHPPGRLAGALRSIDVLCPPARCVTRALADAVRGLGRQLWVYRCDTARALSLARRAGVSAAMSDRPDWLRAEVQRG